MKVKISKEDTKKGNLILVNSNYPLTHFPMEKSMTTILIGDREILLNHQAATILEQLLESLHYKGEIVAVSGFRSQEEQEEIWNMSIQKEGIEYTNKFVAVPGHSEHQTGLAVDLAKAQKQIDNVCPDFPRTGFCDKFRQIAPKYGFIERYIAGKERITGIGEEPWHFRYVGLPHSMIISKLNLVLEEYIEFLKKSTSFNAPYIYHYSGTDIEISYMQIEASESLELDIPQRVPYLISGTNEGGVIVSLWRER